MPDTTAACVRRYKPIKDIAGSEFVRLTRHLTSVLTETYLSQYPALIRLARTVDIIPAPVLTLLEQVGRAIEKKGITGPFCSELVTILLAAADPAILSDVGLPENVAPSDIYHTELFDTITESRDSNELPGQEIAIVAELLENYMSAHETKEQSLRFKLLQLTTVMESIGASAGIDWKEYYINCREDIRKGPLRHLNNRIIDGALVRKWLFDGNKCTETCPLQRADTAATMPLRLSKARKEDSHELCNDIRSCSGIPRTWNKLLVELDLKREGRLQKDMENASRVVRGWSNSERPTT